MTLNSVEIAAERGWKTGYNDFVKLVKHGEWLQTKNPYKVGTTENKRWISGYAQGYNIAQRGEKRKEKT